MAGAFVDVLTSKKVVVLLGAGGVGKTTSATLLAFVAALEGKKVALLSIDPAKRLASALKIPLTGELSKVFTHENGYVEAGMLDYQQVFDQMVDRYAPSKKMAQKIKDHDLYKASIADLSGPLEYMALAKLYDLYQEKKYDLIILDTPPDVAALDFLIRPNVLAGFMDSKVMTWLIKPFSVAQRFGLDRFFQMGEKLMGNLAKITGVSALKSLADFLVSLQDVIHGFHSMSLSLVKVLKSSETGFGIVCAAHSSSARSVEFLTQQLILNQFKVDFLIMNRLTKSADNITPVVHKRITGEKMVEKQILQKFKDDHLNIVRLYETAEEPLGSEAFVQLAKSIV